MLTKAFSLLICLFYFSLASAQTGGILSADQFPGADIFAKANTAAASLAGVPGVVQIPPGTYSHVSTTLRCVSDVEFRMAGVTVNYSGSGIAIKCASVERARITGPLHLLGTRAANTTGLVLGNPVAAQGLTTENSFADITIGDTPGIGALNGFDNGIEVDGNVNSGTYYNEFKRVSSNGNLHGGWVWFPTSPVHANSNRCISCTAVANGTNGFQIDGACFNTFIGIDSEDNGSFGVNFTGTTVTDTNYIAGGDLEGNGSGDFNFGNGGTLISSTTIVGVQSGSANPLIGDPYDGNNNVYWPAAGAGATIAYINGTIIDWPVGIGTSTAHPVLWIRDTENGQGNILRINKTGTGSGNISIGTAQYSLTLVNASGTLGKMTQTIARGVANMPTAPIAGGWCGSPVTVSAPGVKTTDVIDYSFNAFLANGALIVRNWPGADAVNFEYCNPSADTIGPSAATLNWRVTRE